MEEGIQAGRRGFYWLVLHSVRLHPVVKRSITRNNNAPSLWWTSSLFGRVILRTLLCFLKLRERDQIYIKKFSNWNILANFFIIKQYFPLKGRLSFIVRMNVVLNRTVVVDSDWRFQNLCGSHLQSHFDSEDRLSKRQSLSTTTVLFTTTFTRTIKLNLLLKWLLGSNLSQYFHLL